MITSLKSTNERVRLKHYLNRCTELGPQQPLRCLEGFEKSHVCAPCEDTTNNQSDWLTDWLLARSLTHSLTHSLTRVNEYIMIISNKAIWFDWHFQDGGRSKKNDVCHFFRNVVTLQIIVGIAPNLRHRGTMGAPSNFDTLTLVWRHMTFLWPSPFFKNFGVNRR